MFPRVPLDDANSTHSRRTGQPGTAAPLSTLRCNPATAQKSPHVNRQTPNQTVQSSRCKHSHPPRKNTSRTWQQRKLGELGFTYSGLSGKNKSDFGHGSAYFVTYLNVFSNPIADCYGIEAVEIDDKQHKVITGDIFFTASSETPEDVGMTSLWLGAQDNLYLNSFCFGYRMTANHNSIFMAYSLRSPQFRSKIQLLAQGISRFNISKKKVMELISTFPSLSEQIRIAEFFRVLDDLIAAAKKKADLLKLKKRYYLQAIFSQHLRFKGFTKPWQQRKLGDVCKVSKNINKTQYSQSDVLSVSRDAGVVNQVQYQGRSFASNDLSRYRTVTPQSLIYTKSPLKVAPYGIMISSHVHGIVSPLYAVYQCPNNYNHFLSYFFSSSATLNNYLKPLVAKGAKNTINVSDCDAANGMVPYVNAEEVDAIVFIFQILDTLIEEVKDKHDLICRKKAFFLQKMFV